MKKLFSVLACYILILTAPAFAEEKMVVTNNPEMFGNWMIRTSNGMRGMLFVDAGVCHYSLYSSFSAIQTNCVATWHLPSEIGSIAPDTKIQRSFSIPEYTNRNIVETNAGINLTSYSFNITKVKGSKMYGHLLGAGDHVTVVMNKHK